MDSLQGIPVEYKLDTFNMPCTSTTLCHPQNWLCQSDAQLSSWHLALNSPLGHFNGDNARLPTRWTKTTVTPKFNSSNSNVAFAKLWRTQSLARPSWSFGKCRVPFIAIAPRFTLARSGCTWQGLFCGSNRTELFFYVKLNCLK